MRRNVFVQDHAEVARGDIRLVLSALRRLGCKTMDGLDRIARHARLAPRRTKTILMQDYAHVVTDEQRRHLSLAIADLFDRIADEHEEIAERCREKGDAIRHRERHQLALAFGGTQWGERTMSALCSTTASQRQAA